MEMTWILARLVVVALLSAGRPPEKFDAAPGRALVKFRAGAGVASLRMAARDAGPCGAAWRVVEFDEKVPLAQALKAIRASPGVLAAEPDGIVRTYATPNDPSFGLLWSLHNEGQTGGAPDADIDAPEAWETARESGLIVAVTDTGTDWTHPDLSANIWRNEGEIANNGIDDDGNGFVDDVRGWDFWANDKNPRDENGHGTHVAGIIGAMGNNEVGVVGVCWRVRIMPVRFISWQGYGYMSGAVQSIDYAVANGASVINASWGGGYSQALTEAVGRAEAAGVIFVAAAGNDSNNADLHPNYPAALSNANIISVAATTHADERAYFSTWGPTTVDLGAPGEGIYSTFPAVRYATKSGTSMAAPHVAGACALVWATNSALSVADVKAAILSTVDILPMFSGECVSGGRLNLARALGASPPPVTTTTTAPPGTTTTTLPPPPGAVVDNRDAQVMSNSWPASTKVPGFYGGDYQWQYGRTYENARIRFARSDLPEGTYEVSAWWPAASDRASGVAYEVRHADGVTTIRVDQRANGARWNALGTFRFGAGAHAVDVHNGGATPGKYVTADTVRFRAAP